MNAFSIAAGGAMAAADRFASSVQQVAAGQGDDAAEAIAQMAAKQAFEANVAVMRVSDKMTKQLLDITV